MKRWYVAFVALWPAACGGPTPATLENGAGGAGGDMGRATGGVSGSPQILEGRALHAERAVPLIGGTLLVTHDGARAVAADPDRDRVFLVDLHDLQVSSVEAQPGDVPGRIVEGANGVVFVIAQAAGAVFALDSQSASVGWRSRVCNAPRGIDYDPSSDSVYVACRSGAVVQLGANDGAVISTKQFDDDLVDVLAQDGALVLGRRRNAELLFVAADGGLQRATPGWLYVASNGFRMRRLPSGAILWSHLTALADGGLLSNGFGEPSSAWLTVSTTPAVRPEVTGPRSTSTDPLDSAAPAARFDPTPFSGNVGPFDIAVSAAGDRVALLSLGDAWPSLDGMGSLYVAPIDAATGRVAESFWLAASPKSPTLARRPAGEPIAVAFDGKGRLLLQSREPAALIFENGASVALSTESRADSSLALFYTNLGQGLACASCHPAGADDGRSWGARQTVSVSRTRSLEGLLSHGPWARDGHISSFDAALGWMIKDFAASKRSLTTQQLTLLKQWLQELPRPTLPDDLDEAAAARGKLIFERASCGNCHTLPTGTDSRNHDVGSVGSLVTPSLIGVAAHAPYLHDGCAETLEGVFGLCGGSGHAFAATSGERADLVQFLRSL
ncbi:MAG: hypothetical protein QM756_45840 [Polyangiaceae bacterium]